MAASDKCEPQIIAALKKEGWIVTDRPFSIEWDDNYVFADLRLERGQAFQQIIVVEAKCFPLNRSQVYEFHQALGQYLFYQMALELAYRTEKVYLAVPAGTYEWFQSDSVVKALISKYAIKLIIVDLESEEILEWIT